MKTGCEDEPERSSVTSETLAPTVGYEVLLKIREVTGSDWFERPGFVTKPQEYSSAIDFGGKGVLEIMRLDTLVV